MTVANSWLSTPSPLVVHVACHQSPASAANNVTSTSFCSLSFLRTFVLGRQYSFSALFAYLRCLDPLFDHVFRTPFFCVRFLSSMCTFSCPSCSTVRSVCEKARFGFRYHCYVALSILVVTFAGVLRYDLVPNRSTAGHRHRATIVRVCCWHVRRVRLG